MKLILASLRVRGWRVRRCGAVYTVDGVYPELLSAYAVRALWWSGARRRAVETR